MKNIFKKSFITLLALIMVLASMNASAFADSSSLFEVTGYKITQFNGKDVTDNGQFTINKGNTVSIEVKIKCKTTEGNPSDSLDVSRVADSFSGGTPSIRLDSTSSGSKSYTIDVKNLKYKGSGNTLELMVKKGTEYENITVKITEAKEYTEPKEDDTTYTPDPIPAPKAIFSRNELTSDLKAGKTESVTITVKNVGKAVMQNPVLTLSTSDAITLVGGTSSFELSNIAIGGTASVTVQVKALSKIESATQYIDAELDFDYYNRVSTQSTTAKGRVTVPAKVTTKTEETKTEETKTASPVPNVIVTKFNYGGSSVAAGSDFNFSISFKNTSSKLNVENLVVTVDPGTVLTLNGSSNSFYFNKIKPGKSKSISVPMKAQKTLEVNAETVTVSFKYEYVDNKTRTQATADSKLTVPVYQPDRFEIDDPVLEDYITEGTDTTITLNYVNKSKATISNVQATIEGDLTSSLATQNVGNLEAGKSGSIVFSVAPAASGECNYTITIDYEDGNGDEKERVFTGTMNVEEAYIDDGGDYVDDGGDGTDEQTSGIPWWVFVIIAVVVIIAAIIILKKVKKAKLAKKEQELWDSWDEELGGGSGTDANNDKGDK